MSYFLFIFKSALEDFKRNKVRTMLTSLGILIGVASVVLLMAFGLGLKAYITNQFESLGSNQIIISPGKLLSDGGGFSRGGNIGSIKFSEKDVALVKRVKNTKYVVPEYTKSILVTGGGNTEGGTLLATTAEIFSLSNLEPEYGSLWDKSDVDKRSKKVVIGPKIAGKIFGFADLALNKTIKIQNQGYKVVAILKSKGGGGLGGPDFDSYIYVPFYSALTFNPDKKIYSISLMAESKEVIPQVKADIKLQLLKDYKEDEFSIIELTEILNAVSSIFAILNSVLVGIAAISLLVGGIGIMNIMYVSVIERVREIGIRRALGATSRNILLQFVFESIILSLVGGLLGLLVSVIAVVIIRNFFPVYIDRNTVLLALGVSSSTGILFGVFPARKAALLSPIEAIRYE
jgi:putative ABC transport system permease protein